MIGLYMKAKIKKIDAIIEGKCSMNEKWFLSSDSEW